MLDPRRHAVRRDLADIRLADRVFAPHYAAPLQMVTIRACTLLDAPVPAAAVIGPVAEGARFDVFEIASGFGWGIACEVELVGYIDATALVQLFR